MMGMPPIHGRVMDLSGSGLRLWVPTPLPCGSPVKVEAPHILMMCEVVRCEDDVETKEGYVAGLKLLHSENRSPGIIEK